jgi:hypothetical protein
MVKHRYFFNSGALNIPLFFLSLIDAKNCYFL